MRKLLILSFISIFLTTHAYAVDCSDYKTFSHKWNMCKIGKLPGVDGGTTETKSTQKKGSGTIKGLWNKIKTIKF